MKVKRFSAAALLATAALTLLATLGAVFLAAWVSIGPAGLTLLEGLALINTRFVGEYDEDAVLNSAMSGMVAGLGDRWSYYLSPVGYAAEQERRENIYVGVGVTVSYGREEGLLLEAVLPGGPGEAAGLIPGEIITAVDGAAVSGDARNTATELIRGKAGTQVELTLLAEDGSTRTATVTRRAIAEKTIEWEMMENNVGYIQIKNFFSRSAEDFQKAVEELQTQGAAALVLDVRSNGGGYLDELTPMLDFLLPEGPIFRAKSRAGAETVTESDAACVDLPMAVLVNQSTYSAAEIFAGELRERGVAVIVGEPTSGKGYSQQIYPMFGGGALGISTAEYATGSGVSLVGTGLTLDREVALDPEDAALLAQGTLPRREDEQIRAALELLEQ